MEAFHISPATWFVLLAALLVFAAPSAAQSALRHIWAVDDGEKVFRDDIDSPLKTGEHNSIWDGKTVRLFAARNEIVAFQVILEAGDGTAKDVDVLVTDLTNGESAIRGSHPLPRPDSSIGADVELFTEHYLHITVPSWHSQTDKGWYTTTAASPDLAGWIPDALILLSAKPGRGGAPFEIAPNTNQGIWVDIYVPKDLPAGLYVGHIQITAEGAPAARIAVELEVLEFTLPDENHYRSMIYYSPQNIAARHGLTLGPELVEMVLRYHRMAHRHRLELCGRGAWEEAEALKETLTGSAFTLENGYRGPGEGVGNTVFSINTY
ncbi:MAG: hypothetical protein GTN78_21360, partial [Gemmatimonadales bacterium]|nr:hypothetical protein [Gemmatimonadales bacterium]